MTSLLHLPSVCAPVPKFPLVTKTSWSHFNMITLVEALSPNKGLGFEHKNVRRKQSTRLHQPYLQNTHCHRHMWDTSQNASKCQDIIVGYLNFWQLKCILMCHKPNLNYLKIANETESFQMFISNGVFPFHENLPDHDVCPFFIWVDCLLLNFRSLCIYLDTIPLSVKWFTNVFSQSVNNSF
jgi:hypothetical protein